MQCLIRAKNFFIHLVSLGIYPPGTFTREPKYGLTVHVLTSTNEGLTKYLDQIMDQMSTWLLEGQMQSLVKAILGIETNETHECWQFQVMVGDKDGESAVLALKKIMLQREMSSRKLE